MTEQDREKRVEALVRDKRVAEDNDPRNAAINSVSGLVELVRQTLPLRTVIEVGSNLGVSSEVFLLFATERVVCVDPWADPTGNLRFQMFMARCGSYPHLRVVRDYSPEAAARFTDESFDLLYLDADHHYENAKRDLLAWVPKVRRGGFIAGHDYNRVDASFGVIQAVDEILGKPASLFSDTSWLYKKERS